MKKLTTHAIFAATLTAGFAILHAQDAAPAGTPAVVPQATAPAAPAETAAPSMPAGSPQTAIPQPEALPLMPQAAQGPPAQPTATPGAGARAKHGHPKPGVTVLIKTPEQLRQLVRIRELKTQVLLENPEVNAWLAKAELMKTYEGRRIARRNYYTVLYTSIEKLDPSLHDIIEQKLYSQLFALEQHRVRPSQLIESIVQLPGSHSADHMKAAVAAAAALPAPEAAGTPEPEDSEGPPVVDEDVMP